MEVRRARYAKDLSAIDDNAASADKAEREVDAVTF
jgi:hypothetical protein